MTNEEKYKEKLKLYLQIKGRMEMLEREFENCNVRAANAEGQAYALKEEYGFDDVKHGVLLAQAREELAKPSEAPKQENTAAKAEPKPKTK